MVILFHWAVNRSVCIYCEGGGVAGVMRGAEQSICQLWVNSALFFRVLWLGELEMFDGEEENEMCSRKVLLTESFSIL